MEPTDEELLHAFYTHNDTAALGQLAERLDPILIRMAMLVLWARSGSLAHALGEWELDDRVAGMWSRVLLSRTAGFGRWPWERISALTWLNHVLCQEIDHHLELRPPF